MSKQAVYAAEWALRAMLERSHECPTVEIHGSTLTLPTERKFADIASIEQYVNKVLQLNWVRESYSRAKVPVRVRKRHGQAHAHYERLHATIAIPPWEGNRAWAMRELVVLHELAHHLDTGTGHGISFARTFLHLIGEIMGAEVEFILSTLFYDEGVFNA